MDKGPIFEKIPGAPSCHCSTLHKFPDGSVIVGFFAGAYEKAPDVAIWGANGNASGTTWTEPRVLADTPNKSEGSPVFYQEGSGKLHLWFLTMHHGWLIGGKLPTGWSVCTIKHQTSLDNGYTWSRWDFLRNMWFWVLRGQACRLQNGSVLLPVHREIGKYQSMVYINPKPDLSGRWKRYGRLDTPKGCLEPSICELPDGRLLCSLRTKDGITYLARSSDHGHTWTKPAPTMFYNPNSQTALCCTSKGKVVLVLNNLPKGRHWLAYTVSDDGGYTWSPLETIHGKDDPSETGKQYSYPSIIELADGKLLVSYTWNREQIWWARFRL